MIDLAVHFRAMEMESCAGIPERPLFFVIGLSEVTLLVVGILTMMEVGPFGGLTTAHAIGFFAGGGALFGLDVARLVTHFVRYGKKSEGETFEDTTLAGGIEPQACTDEEYYKLDLHLLCKSSEGDTRSHIYAVFPLVELPNLVDRVGEAHVLYFEKPTDYTSENIAVGTFSQGALKKLGMLFSSGGTISPLISKIRKNQIIIYQPKPL